MVIDPTGGTVYVNQNSSGSTMGGTFRSTMTITEYF